MAIKAGQILHVANQFVVDRIQTGGAGNLNIPQEKVYELGNYQSVGIVRDVPDLTFSLECLEVDTEVEALLTGRLDPAGDAASTKYELANNKVLDIISPWKSPYGEFEAVRGVVIPGLALESASYRYGLRDNAGETFSLRGDAIFYIPGTPWQDMIVFTDADTGGPSGAVPFENGPAILYQEGGNDIFALSVMVGGERYYSGTDYTEDEDGVTFSAAREAEMDALVLALTGTETLVVSITYGSLDSLATYPQTGGQTPDFGRTPPDAATVHEGVAVKPAAIRGKDIDVYFSTAIARGGGVNNKALTSNVATLTTASAHGLAIGDVVTVAGVDSTFNGTYTVASVPSATTFTYAKTHANVGTAAVSPVGSATAALEVRWPDVQSCTIDWRVTLEDDYEFGNPRAVSREATDVPAVTGTVELKPRSVTAFFDRLTQITGVPASQVVGPQSSVAGAMRVAIRNPGSGGSTAVAAGTVLKTHYVPDARFVMPGYEGRVQTKLTNTVNWESDTGVLETYKGVRA